MSGLIHLYCGDGKGKTTAATGLSIRAAGNSMKVVFCQFMKGRDTSELNILNDIPQITVVRCEKDFGFYSTMTEETKAAAKRAYNDILAKAVQLAREYGKTGRCLVVFDEITYAWEYGFIDRGVLTDFVDSRSEGTEIVFTGRNPDKFFVDRADYISEMV